jgi:hypothetical protein
MRNVPQLYSPCICDADLNAPVACSRDLASNNITEVTDTSVAELSNLEEL